MAAARTSRISLAVVALSLAAMTGAAAQSAQPAAHRATETHHAIGEIDGIAAVPHSSDVWSYADTGGGEANTRYFELHRHHGKWAKVKPPKLGGRYGTINTIASASAKAVWLGGGRQAEQIQEIPTIWRLQGKRFVEQTLPGLSDGAVAVSSISASSPTNAWAVGGFYPTAPNSPNQISLHWDGKTWGAVPFPIGNDNEGLSVVSTSGPTNAWATRADGAMIHWNGAAWAVDGQFTAGAQLTGIATSSPSLAYAVGFNSVNERPVILKFNGTAWANVPIASNVGKAELFSVTMSGTSAWAATSRIKGRSTYPEILHGSGGVWKLQPSGGKGIQLSSISAASSKNVYAGGSFRAHAESGQTFPFVDSYNGHKWKGAVE